MYSAYPSQFNWDKNLLILPLYGNANIFQK
jgi:hypothetical protein